MTTLVQEIEERLAGAKVESQWQSVGFIREIGDGVARVEGLHDVMLNEMLDLGQGVTGIALSLEESEVGAILLGEGRKLQSQAGSRLGFRCRILDAHRHARAPVAMPGGGRAETT